MTHNSLLDGVGLQRAFLEKIEEFYKYPYNNFL
jgi:hypothetical protein